MSKRLLWWSSVLVFALGHFGVLQEATAAEADPAVVEVLNHAWKPDEVWERIGKTKYIWHATVRNNSDSRQRVFVYYDLLGEGDVPLARTVTNRYLKPHETAEITADSYIESHDLPYVKRGRIRLQVRSHL